MADPDADAAGQFAYTGCDNLEAMTEAVRYNRFLTDSVLAQVRSEDARVLDFGAGAGTYADMLLERGIRADCLEPDPTLGARLVGKGYRVLDGPGLGGEDHAYDVVYTLNVLEHIQNDQQACDDLAAVLRPGGRLVVYVPALEMLFTSMDVKVAHYRRYRRAQLMRLLDNAGLTVLSARYCDPIGVFATLFYKWFGRDDGTISTPALKLYDRAVFPLSRALQVVTGRLFGKNLLVVATKE